MKEDEIAALDSEWSQFTPEEQAAFGLARRLTFEPHRISDADFDTVRKYYSDLQILEIILSVAGNNSINRWKEGVGVPQSESGGGFGERRASGTVQNNPHSYLTPTSPAFSSKVTNVAALILDENTREPTRETVCFRPTLTRAEANESLAICRNRTPRLPLVDENTARSLLPDGWQGPVRQWVRLLANSPTSAKGPIASIISADQRGDLSPLLKAQVSWIIARQDCAWYALGLAKKRLHELGQSEEEIYKLDGD